MGIKYKLKLRDLKLEYLLEYMRPILKFFKPKQKINNYEELKDFIQKKIGLDKSSHLIRVFED